MAALLLVLTPIALLDSASIIPISIAALVVVLAGPKPLLTSVSFVLGIFAINLTTGLLLLLTLDIAFDALHSYAVRLIDDPNTEEIIFQISIGLLLCAFGLRISKSRGRRRDEPTRSGLSPARAFLFGVGVTFLGVPGGLPYFAAIDLVLRAEVTSLQQVAAVSFYNVIFVSPLAAIIVIRQVLGVRGDEILGVVRRFIDKWGQRVVVSVLVGFGLILVIDGIGWFLGFPIIVL